MKEGLGGPFWTWLHWTNWRVTLPVGKGHQAAVAERVTRDLAAGRLVQLLVTNWPIPELNQEVQATKGFNVIGTANDRVLNLERERIVPVIWPALPPSMTEAGRWGVVSGGTGIMGQLTLSTPVKINYRVPPGGDRQALEDRVCAFGSGHPRGANFAFADSSVRFLRDSTPLPTLQALSTRCCGEAVIGH